MIFRLVFKVECCPLEFSSPSVTVVFVKMELELLPILLALAIVA